MTYVFTESHERIFLEKASELPAKYASMSGCWKEKDFIFGRNSIKIPYFSHLIPAEGAN